MKNNILLLGKGYIGKYLYKGLLANNNITWISKQDLNYSDPYTFQKFLGNNNFNWIINSSGYTGKPNVDACEDDKESCYYYNVTVPIFLTKIAHSENIPIIHIGSGCIYSGYNKVYDELDSPDFGYDCFNSSFYSKTKHTFEKLTSDYSRYIFRIRIPFNGVVESKNYLYKLHHYNNLISCKNSVTNVDDLTTFTAKFVNRSQKDINMYKHSIFNVVNSGAIEAREIIEMFKQNGIVNPNWKFVTLEQSKFRVERSNCVLKSSYLQGTNFELPSVKERMSTAVAEYCKEL